MNISLCITCWTKDFVYLNNLLYLLQQQTYAPNEIIVSSSGLNELQLNTIPNSIKIKDKEVVVVRTNNPIPYYAANARNKGQSICNSEYISYFDVDDTPHPQRIEMIYKSLKEDIDILITNYEYEDRAFNSFTLYKDIGDVVRVTKQREGYSQLDAKYPGAAGHVTVRCSSFNKYNVRYDECREASGYEDGIFLVNALLKGAKIYCTDLKLMNYVKK